jgi:hypothetical protein
MRWGSARLRSIWRIPRYSYYTIGRGDEFGSIGGLGDESMCPQPSTLRDSRSILNSQEYNLGCGRYSTYLAGSREAVHYGHVDVEDHNVRF